MRHWIWCDIDQRIPILTSASPRSILVLSGRYHIISNASLVNNCILLWRWRHACPWTHFYLFFCWKKTSINLGLSFNGYYFKSQLFHLIIILITGIRPFGNSIFEIILPPSSEAGMPGEKNWMCWVSRTVEIPCPTWSHFIQDKSKISIYLSLDKYNV